MDEFSLEQIGPANLRSSISPIWAPLFHLSPSRFPLFSLPLTLDLNKRSALNGESEILETKRGQRWRKGGRERLSWGGEIGPLFRASLLSRVLYGLSRICGILSYQKSLRRKRPFVSLFAGTREWDCVSSLHQFTCPQNCTILWLCSTFHFYIGKLFKNVYVQKKCNEHCLMYILVL